MDIKERARGQANGIERMRLQIPGFKGYYERELRRDADKLQRDFIVTRLRRAKDDLSTVMSDLTRQHRLDTLSAFDALGRQLDRLINEIRYADRGFSGFFDLIKIKEGELDAVYEIDAGLAEKAEAAAAGFRDLATAPLAEGKLDGMKAVLADIADQFNRRTETLKGYK
jgi:hypothetical protein